MWWAGRMLEWDYGGTGSIPAAGGDPSPMSHCPVTCMGPFPTPYQPQEPCGASARGSGSTAPHWVAAAGAAGSGCVTRSLLGRKQTLVEKPWLCLASHCLRSGAAGCRLHLCSRCPAWDGGSGRNWDLGKPAADASHHSQAGGQPRRSTAHPMARSGVLQLGWPQSCSPTAVKTRCLSSRCFRFLYLLLCGGEPLKPGVGRQWAGMGGQWALPHPCTWKWVAWPVTAAVTWRLRLGLPCLPGH